MNKTVKNSANTNQIIISSKKLSDIAFKSFLHIKENIGENKILLNYELINRSMDGRNFQAVTLPKYFGFQTIIGIFKNEQLPLLRNNSMFLIEEMKILNYQNTYFTSQWNESEISKRTLINFNQFLKDVSNNTLEIIKENNKFNLVKKHSYINNENIIFYGSPGTGKSHKVNELTKDMITERITFHPEYDYASFVGGYKPIMKGDDIRYEFVPQAFTNIYVKAWQNLDKPYYLVIEEINRGNCAEIFGDIFQLLDRDSGYEVTPSQELKEHLAKELPNNCEKLVLPPNLSILATMNTSDQSLYPMDSAFKRRWDWEYIPINYDADINNNPSASFEVQLSETESFSWLAFIKAVNTNIKSDPNLGMDKCLGNYFIKPKKSNVIELKTFINKAIFYLWNDVFKDEPDNSIFAEKSSYEDFFPIDSNGQEQMRKILDSLEVTIETAETDTTDQNDSGE